MMIDNSSAHSSSDYDAEIAATLPYLDLFYQATIDVVRAISETTGDNRPPRRWLDTGCGTGAFCAEAMRKFPNTEFTLADPSVAMLEIAKGKAGTSDHVSFELSGTAGLGFLDGYFDVISAIQCHHYLDQAGRAQATANCFRMLRVGGIYVEFENILPLTQRGQDIGLQMWKTYQIEHGKAPAQAADHIGRFNTGYFPISIPDHLALLEDTGFTVTEILWASFMQAGFYAIK